MYNQPSAQRYSGESGRGQQPAAGLEFQSFSYGNPLQQQQYSQQQQQAQQATSSSSYTAASSSTTTMSQPVSWKTVREAFSSTVGFDEPPLFEGGLHM
jgi:hypothetical protein